MEIAIKILEGAIAQRELGNKTVPNNLRLKESLEEIESLTKAVRELKNLHKANVIKSVCGCVDGYYIDNGGKKQICRHPDCRK